MPENIESINAEEPKRRKKKKKKGGWLFTLLIILCLIGMGISLYIFLGRVFQYKESKDTYNDIRSAVITVNDEFDAPAIEPDKEDEPAQEEKEEAVDKSLIPPISVDFNALKMINEDCVGWIYIEANQLSFPIMHGETNDDYLYTTIEGTYNICGSIFMEALNSTDFTDPNTIIYGHKMTDGSMFGANKYFFTSDDIYSISPYFWILTPQGNYKYKIFSIHQPDAMGDAYTLFYGTDKQFLDWCVAMKDDSQRDCGPQDFKLEDHVVTLSCCNGTEYTRYVLQGVCISGDIVPVEEEPSKAE